MMTDAPIRPLTEQQASAAEKQAARLAVQRAVERRAIVRPDACSECGDRPAGHLIHAHHSDYTQPLLVEWLCVSCHVRRHRPVRS